MVVDLCDPGFSIPGVTTHSGTRLAGLAAGLAVGAVVGAGAGGDGAGGDVLLCLGSVVLV